MSVNKVILVGNVGQEPTIKHFDNDSMVANFSMATTERGYTTKSGKVIDDRTEWHNITVWGGLAKVVESYVHKGDPLYVEGKIRTRTYEKDGITRYATDIHVDNLQMLGRKGDRDSSPSPTQSTHVPQGVIESKAKEDDDLPF